MAATRVKGGFWAGLAILLGFVALAFAGVFLGAAALERLARPSSACPKCGNPVKHGSTPCPSCGTGLRWEAR
jgi:hypothetical protein